MLCITAYFLTVGQEAGVCSYYPDEISAALTLEEKVRSRVRCVCAGHERCGAESILHFQVASMVEWVTLAHAAMERSGEAVKRLCACLQPSLLVCGADQ